MNAQVVRIIIPFLPFLIYGLCMSIICTITLGSCYCSSAHVGLSELFDSNLNTYFAWVLVKHIYLFEVLNYHIK